MLTIKQAFEKFRTRLELSATEQKDAERRHNELREYICGNFDVANDFLAGSYRRNTKTKPLKDVDVIFVLGKREFWRRQKPPVETLDAFEQYLKKRYGEIECNRRAITVEFEKSYYPEDHDGRVLSIDAVPAFECQGGNYEIPDKVLGSWIKTNPDRHREHATAKNKELGGNWVPLVKMLKAWNRANGKTIKPSFLVEVMAEGLIDAPFSGYAEEVRNFFAAAEAAMGQAWPDPAGLGPPVSDQMTPEHIEKARRALGEAQKKAALAFRAAATGRQGDSLQIWREILGPYFPMT